jgi:hypothetical protein
MNCFVWKQLEAVSALGASSGDERLKESPFKWHKEARWI